MAHADDDIPIALNPERDEFGAKGHTVGWITRVAAYPILERELMNRIADRDAQIVSLKVEVQELRDRLYMRHGFVPSGEKIASKPGAIIPPYRTGRQRLKDMVTPKVELLSDEEAKIIEESVTQ